MTFAQLQAEVRRRLNETTAVFWTDDDIKEAINDGYEELADATEFYERYANVPLMPQRTYHDLRSSLPDVFLSVKRCWNTTTEKWMEPTGTRDMDFHTFVQWETTTGNPEKYFTRGLWWFGSWPKATVPRTARVYYSALPDALVDDSDEPELPREFHYGIVEYALSDLFAQERESAKTAEHWNEYLQHEERLRQYVQGRQSFARLEVL